MQTDGVAVSGTVRLRAGPPSLWTALDRYPQLLAYFRIALLAFQLGLFVVAVQRFRLINRAFVYLAILTWAGFVVHALLPRRYRLPSFAVLSIAGVAIVLGPINALWLVLLGVLIIGACQLPAPFWTRVLVVGGIAGLLAVLRETAANPAFHAIVVVLASMFMFRLIIFLFELKQGKPDKSRLWPLSYFFLLPNVSFPLFPLVDYRKFKATYYNDEEHVIYQRGIAWMFRGVYHLLLYRVVYLYFANDPAQVAGAAELFQYSVTSFLLYLRVSGTFHLIVGMLLLFGFNLPETHRRYYLASNFTDFWRRINIYWTD